ncbi:ribosome maturation factor RimM [uncultured Algimonas sp.]|uniref:ribosome maturation factor RimM n=1 Tax=uncultured Algimonas sp. TaxID=1547920 RepID=UPI0026389E2A|nr:ribosome maturation factor RimM [uncultured Algimonas sp.]
MSKPHLTCVGAVAGAHGVHGNIKVKAFTADPAAFAAYGPLLDERGERLFTPKTARPVGKFFSLSVTEKFTREQVEAMKSTKLYVPRDALPEPEDEEYYYADLVGLTVEDQNGAVVGEVQAVHEFGAGDTLEIKPPSGPSFYHPFTKAHAPSVDLAAGRLVIVREEAEEARGDGAPPE